VCSYKTGEHLTVTIIITDDRVAVTRKQDQIDAEAALDGFYVPRTSSPSLRGRPGEPHLASAWHFDPISTMPE
jgi:hypothetical protein